MTKPIPIQRSRKKGHKHPPGTLFVTRPGPFGNPFTVEWYKKVGHPATDQDIRHWCVRAFRVWLVSPIGSQLWDSPESERRRAWILANLHKIREATHVACWCKPGSPCHATVLIELAYEGIRSEADELRLASLRKRHQVRTYREELDRDLKVLTDD